MQSSPTSAPFGTLDYLQDRMARPGNVSEKISLANKLAEAAKANLDKRLTETYQDTLFADRDKTEDDDKFMEEAEKKIDELRDKIIDYFVNRVNPEVNGTEKTTCGQEVTPLLGIFNLATIKSLDVILDVSNAKLSQPTTWATTFSDTMGRDIDDSIARKVAIQEIMQKCASDPTMYRNKVDF